MRNRRTRGAFLPAMITLMVLVGVSMAGASQSGIADLVSRAREVVFGDPSDRRDEAGGPRDGDPASSDDSTTGYTDPKDHRGSGLANALEHPGRGRRGDGGSGAGVGRGDHGRSGEYTGDRGRPGDRHGNASGGRGRSGESRGPGASSGQGQRDRSPATGREPGDRRERATLDSAPVSP